MTMRKTDSLAIRPGERVAFSPGDRHLMPIGPGRALMPDRSVELDLRFASGERQRVAFEIVETVLPRTRARVRER